MAFGDGIIITSLDFNSAFFPLSSFCRNYFNQTEKKKQTLLDYEYCNAYRNTEYSQIPHKFDHIHSVNNISGLIHSLYCSLWTLSIFTMTTQNQPKSLEEKKNPINRLGGHIRNKRKQQQLILDFFFFCSHCGSIMRCSVNQKPVGPHNAHCTSNSTKHWLVFIIHR